MKLRLPRALRTTVEQLLRAPRGQQELRTALSELESDELLYCLQCARDWNTTATHSITAHRLLHALLQARFMMGSVVKTQ